MSRLTVSASDTSSFGMSLLVAIGKLLLIGAMTWSFTMLGFHWQWHDVAIGLAWSVAALVSFVCLLQFLNSTILRIRGVVTGEKRLVFRLRTMIVGVTGLCLLLTPLAWNMRHARQLRENVAQIRKLGGDYEYWSLDESVPEWLVTLAGEDAFRTLDTINLEYSEVKKLPRFRHVAHVRVLRLNGLELDDLDGIEAFTNLDRLTLDYTGLHRSGHQPACPLSKP